MLPTEAKLPIVAVLFAVEFTTTALLKNVPAVGRFVAKYKAELAVPELLSLKVTAPVPKAPMFCT